MYLIENAEGIQLLNKLILSQNGDEAGFSLPKATSDPTTVSAGDFYYNTTSNEVKFYNGTEWLVLISGTINSLVPVQYNINSDDTVSATAIFEGYINISTSTEVFNSTRLSSVDYETSEDGGDTWATHADITALKGWVDTNITLNTDVYLIRAVGFYNSGQVGEAEIKFEFTPELL